MNKGRKHRRGGKGRHKGKGGGGGGGGGGDAHTTAEDDVEDQTCPESPAGQSQPSSSTAGDEQCNKEGENQDNKQENTQGNQDDKQGGSQSDPQCNKQNDDQGEKNDKQCHRQDDKKADRQGDKQGSKQCKKQGNKEGKKQNNMQGGKQVEMQADKQCDKQGNKQESMQGDGQGSKQDSKQGNKQGDNQNTKQGSKKGNKQDIKQSDEQSNKQGNKQDKKQGNKQRNNQDSKQGDEQDRKQDNQRGEQGNKRDSKNGDKRDSKQSNKQNSEQGNKQGKKQDIKPGNNQCTKQDSKQSSEQDSMQGDNQDSKQSSKQSSQQGSPPLEDDPEAVRDLLLPPLHQRCYVVKKSDVMGRYLVASRDLEAGELIMEEEALVVGPSQTFKPFCIGCYQPLYEEQPYRCASCGWPLCAGACPGAGHCASECAAWAAAGLRLRPTPSPLAYQAVMALRCLLLRDDDPPRWHALRRMESHDALRRGLPELWRHNQAVIVERIRCDWGLAERFTEEEVHSICGILEVNAFEVGQHGTRALYPTAFLLAHDCVPNTAHSDDPRSFALRVRAATPVRAGRPLTLSYAYTLQGTQKRREHLHDSKFFWCSCARCEDPSELGSMASALPCPECEQGHLLPSAPLCPDGPWPCGRCGFALDARAVRLLVDRMSDELESTDANSVEALEGFLRKHGNALHPQHYLALSAKHSLAQLYGKAEGYTIHELSQEQLQRKRDLCRQLLAVYDVLEPGLSRLRGVCLYELHAPIMILATRGFEARTLTPSQLAQQLREVERCLREAARILQLEPEGSSERDMGAAAADALARMQDWHRVIAAL